MSRRTEKPDRVAISSVVACMPSFKAMYRRWYSQTEGLLSAPDLSDDGWLSIRDAHERLGALIRRSPRRDDHGDR